MTARRVLSCLTLLFSLGCGEPSSQPPAQPAADVPPAATSAARDEPPPAPAAGQDPIPLTVESWEEIQRWVADQKGKIVVLDLWSTWCVPCVREFPNLVKLHQAHPQDVVCVSFNLDYSGAAGETPESFREPVSEFLKKQTAAFKNVISRDAADDVFQRLQLGSIPAVLVYGRDGQLAKRFDNDDGTYGDEGFTYDKHIVPLVEELLAGAGVGGATFLPPAQTKQ